MNVTPLKKKVLIAENKRENTTESGIILDNVRGSNTTTGTVIAIGPDVTLVAVGDEVYLDWAKASVVKIGDAQRVIIDEDLIIAVVEK